MPAGLKSKLWLNPTVAYPAISAGLLIAIFLVYYFPVTSRQEASLNDRAFRSLAAVSDRLRNRIVSYSTVLEQATKKEKDQPARLPQDVRDYLEEQVPDLTFVDKQFGEEDCKGGGTRASFAADNAQYSIELACGKWRARLSLDKAMPQYLQGTPGQLFDQILVTDPSGKVLYETGRTADRINQMSSALTVFHAPPAKTDEKAEKESGASTGFEVAGNMSSLASMHIGSEQYNVYLVPVLLNRADGVTKAASEDALPSHVVLCGLIRETRFRSQSMALPATVLVTIVLLLLAVMASTSPLFKFTSMRATDNVPRRTARYFWLCMAATIVLICILALHGLYAYDTSTVDNNLKNLAAAIESHLVQEIRQAMSVMDALQRSRLLQDIAKEQPRESCNSPTHVQPQLLSHKELQISAYPYFDRVFWTDSRGAQHIKFEIASHTTAQTNVKARPYYQATVENRLWSFADDGPNATRFRIDPIFSINTGEYLAVISRRPKTKIRICTDGNELAVESMVTPLLSLINPVVPPNYGFAVIDPEGKVLFHSTSIKNGQENFFNELDDDREVRASIQARKGEHLTVRYSGFEHRLFVTPMLKLPQAPWSFIVFHDLSARSDQHRERIVLFAALSLIYLALLFVVLLALPAGHYPPTWLWPSQGKQDIYLRLIVALMLIAPAFYLLIFELPLRILPGAAFVMPLVTLGLVVLRLNPIHRFVPWAAFAALAVLILAVCGFNERLLSLGLWILFGVLIPWLPFNDPFKTKFEKWSRKRSLRNTFTAGFAFTLLLGGVLPSIALFKVAYDYHQDLSMRWQQVQTLSTLNDREQRVKDRYAKLFLASGMNNKDGMDVGRWLFLRRRLDHTLDRYDTEFLEVSGLQLSADKSVTSAANSGQTEESSLWRRDDLPDGMSMLASYVPYGWGTLTGHLSGTSTVNPTWDWLLGGNNQIRIQPANGSALNAAGIPGSPVTTALLKSVTNDQVFLSPVLVSELAPLQPWCWKWSVPVFVIGFLITFLWIKPTLLRMFLFDSRLVKPLPLFDPHRPIKHNYIVLVQDDAAVEDVLRTRKDVLFTDLLHIAKDGPLLDLSNIAEPIVIVSHFDDRTDQGANKKKLEFLEHLVAQRPSKAVVILTRTDPSFGIKEGEFGEVSTSVSQTNREAERWFRALVGFKRVRSLACPADNARDRYAIQWSACTTKERVALYQLAHFGWPNYKNYEAFQQLASRGLVQNIPPHFVEEGFRQFVDRTVKPEDLKLWSNLDSASIWGGVRLVFVVLSLGLVAASLFFNEELLLGWIVSAAGVLATFSKLFSEADGLGAALHLGKEEKNS